MLKAKYLIPILYLLFLKLGFAQTNINTRISIGPEGLKSFYFSISEYYQIPESQVVIIQKRKIPDEELPVVFFIAGKTKVKPEVIVDLRLGGSSWYDISVKYGIYSDVYFVPLESSPGPPYGKAYGYYKNKPRKEWKSLKLTDKDIINFVNLRFISEYYNYQPDKIVKMRNEGNSYILINSNVKIERSVNKNKDKGKGKRKINSKH